MFKRVLIANRGEIAVRIIRACQEMGIETVAVYSDEDADAMHVRLADYSYNIGPADASESYLNIDALMEAAERTEADAVHPGYGFLSEDADFAEMVTKAGMTWIGPWADTIRKVGDKDEARAAMIPSGIPMSKGSTPVTSVEQAKDVGYPIILKPVAGGGGKGMLIANSEDDLRNILTIIDINKVKYYFEHYIEHSRHIEVQIVADNYGHVIHLGERECSLQRRNQKLLEESPSIALTPDRRAEVGALAIKAAKSVHYNNIGTVEFLLDLKTNQFNFMEINPRIQVEHGVTEAVTGIDLVRTQIRIAAGESLDLQQEDVKFTGHAIECRIYAEPRVRVDSGVCAGLSISPYYDSLIAKIVVRGRTRGDAIKIMRRALNEFKVGGIKTTIPLHQRILKNEYFCTGDIDTRFIRNHFSKYVQPMTPAQLKASKTAKTEKEIINAINASMYYA